MSAPHTILDSLPSFCQKLSKSVLRKFWQKQFCTLFFETWCIHPLTHPVLALHPQLSVLHDQILRKFRKLLQPGYMLTTKQKVKWRAGCKEKHQFLYDCQLSTPLRSQNPSMTPWSHILNSTTRNEIADGLTTVQCCWTNLPSWTNLRHIMYVLSSFSPSSVQFISRVLSRVSVLHRSPSYSRALLHT